MVRNVEKKRLATAWDCFYLLRYHLEKLQNEFPPWDLWEKMGDARILEKTNFKVTLRQIGFVIEKKDEFLRMRNEYHNIVYSDRIYILKMKVVEGTQSLHMVASTSEKHVTCAVLRKLRIAKMPCSCLPCRGKGDGSCKFIELRDETEIWVREEIEGDRPKRTQLEPEKEKKLCAKLLQHVGLDRTTVANIKIYLRLRGLTISGNKIELAERALAAEDPPDVSAMMPLAIHVIQDDQMLDSQDDDCGV